MTAVSERGWTADRIAELREDCRARTDVYLGDYVVKSSTFLSLLDELERAREGEWIAVSPETMPEPWTAVLAYCESGAVRIARTDAALRLWSTIPGDYRIQPSHWRPLPAPPVLP